jgi:hypothetical protein
MYVECPIGCLIHPPLQTFNRQPLSADASLFVEIEKIIRKLFLKIVSTDRVPSTTPPGLADFEDRFLIREGHPGQESNSFFLRFGPSGESGLRVGFLPLPIGTSFVIALCQYLVRQGSPFLLRKFSLEDRAFFFLATSSWPEDY